MTDIPPLDAGELYRMVADSTPDAIVTIDEDSVVLSINPAGERLFGYSAREAIGNTVGQGSTFVVSLKLAEAAAAPAPGGRRT